MIIYPTILFKIKLMTAHSFLNPLLKLLYIFVIFALLVSPSQSYVQAEDNSTLPTYTIQPGDTLGTIAELFGTTTLDILNVNSFSDPNFISPGDVIYIPGFPQGVHGELTILQTQLGETFSALQKQYQLDANELISINKLISPTQIYVGSQVIVTLPTGSPSLNPKKILGNPDSLLEISIGLNRNPYSLLLLNGENNPTSLIKNTPVYDVPSEGDRDFSLFAPVFNLVELSPLPVTQGNTEIVHIMSETPVTLSGELDGNPLQFFEIATGDYAALQGIYALAEPGLVDFVLNAVFEDGRTINYSQKVLLRPGNFAEDPPLNVDPKTIDPETNASENKLISGLISNVTPTRYWTSMFQSPAVYQEFNSLFGTRRTYNDDPTVTFHAGVDFAGGITLPIYAPAEGKVVFAGPLTVRGNTTFIDHGWGVYSGFFHQNKLNVKVGDIVTAGQIIGEVGNTGRVNRNGDYYGVGAHLHWEVWVNGMQVNPLDWLDNEYP